MTPPPKLIPFSLSLVAILSISTGILVADEPLSPPVTGKVSGRVIDGSGEGISDAVVFLCDQKTGMPVGSETRNALTHKRFHGENEAPLWTQTNSSGLFSFKEIHAGTYRVFAQKWEQPAKDPFAVNGLTVDLLGSADHLKVPSAAVQSITLSANGTGTLTFPGQTGNDGSYALVSTEYPGDAALGFFGWQAPFGNHVLGFNRMKRGKTTFRGLPEGKVGYVVFANDNSPGFNSGRALISPRQQHQTGKSSEEDMVAGWSNARYSPLPELQPVFNHVKQMTKQGRVGEIWDAMAKGTDAEGQLQVSNLRDLMNRDNYSLWKSIVPLERKFQLPEFERMVTVNETLASFRYLRMEELFADRMARRKRQQKSQTTPPDDVSEEDN